MGEVTPGPPLLQAGLLSSAPGEDARSLVGELTGAEGAGEVGTPAATPEEVVPPAVLGVLEEAFTGCSTLPWVLESFFASASAGTGMPAYLKDD